MRPITQTNLSHLSGDACSRDVFPSLLIMVAMAYNHCYNNYQQFCHSAVFSFTCTSIRLNMEDTPSYRALRRSDNHRIEEFFKNKAVRYVVAVIVMIFALAAGYKFMFPSGSKTVNLPALNELANSSTSTDKVDRAKIESLNDDVKSMKTDIDATRLKLDAATLLIDDQNKKIIELEAKLDKQIADIQERNEAAAKKAADQAKFEQANKAFDIYSIQVAQLTPDAMVVIDNGKRVTVFPGQPLPSGVIFISYDPKSKILKTSAGVFQVTK